MANDSAPHYVRFARAIALVAVAGTVTISGCCPMIPDSIACNHCACYATVRSVSAPLLCDTIHRGAVCCPPVWPATPGPLAPPDLAVA